MFGENRRLAPVLEQHKAEKEDHIFRTCCRRAQRTTAARDQPQLD